MISLNQRWNVGLTHSNLRLEKAIKPVIVLSFKPDQKEIFKQLKEKYDQRSIESNGLTVDISPKQINELAESRLKQHNGLGFYDNMSGYY